MAKKERGAKKFFSHAIACQDYTPAKRGIKKIIAVGILWEIYEAMKSVARKMQEYKGVL